MAALKESMSSGATKRLGVFACRLGANIFTPDTRSLEPSKDIEYLGNISFVPLMTFSGIREGSKEAGSESISDCLVLSGSQYVVRYGLIGSRK